MTEKAMTLISTGLCVRKRIILFILDVALSYSMVIVDLLKIFLKFSEICYSYSERDIIITTFILV